MKQWYFFKGDQPVLAVSPFDEVDSSIMFGMDVRTGVFTSSSDLFKYYWYGDDGPDFEQLDEAEFNRRLKQIKAKYSIGTIDESAVRKMMAAYD